MTIYEELALAYARDIKGLLERLVELVESESRQIGRLTDEQVEMIEALKQHADEDPVVLD